MNSKTAEQILALAHELKKSQLLAQRIAEDEASFDVGESDILQLAAERIMERIFQAASALPHENQVKYFGEEPLQFLRGMRNRLAHNYLGVDNRILRATIQENLPGILANMQHDVDAARSFTASAQAELGNQDQWAQQHLGDL
ncbi:MAG TPA: DUF86 domain-containing protein [Terrimesophilobacter sp.]|nr:DUF86 domain-containing protein [Terrimesophilobacter sp.]HRP98876.1 DUF86 domain-containing protein [Terrimesophilobacter sp.]